MFHPDIVSQSPFVPHAYQQLVDMHAFRPEQMPESAYLKICAEFAAVDDVNVHAITYRHDGLNITGLMAIPIATQPRAHDLIIYNRGGAGNYGLLTAHAVMRQFVPLARAGYVVVGSNYRGNAGGDGHDEFGGLEVTDVVKLHDIMREHPAVNAKPCFTIGHSRGGMMTYLLIKRGLSMRAAIAIAAISDLYGWQSARDSMRASVYTRYIPDFSAHEDASLLERSALHWPEALTAPLLLLHGTKDEAVPHEQSEALAAKLKALDAPHELVLFAGGNHALTRFWPEVMQQTLNWLKRYE